MPNTGNFAEQLKLQLPSWMNSVQLTGFSKDFFELVRDIGEAKSKEEEERIIKHEAQKLKTSMAQPDHNKRMREYLIRAVYCVMLGHDVPFAYIHALNMTQDHNIYNKRTAYLAVSLCLHESHELMILVVNSIQKGLASTSYLEICSALIALCKLINVDVIPAFLPTVVNLLTHNRAAVRKKAVMAIHRFWLKSPDSISHLSDKLRTVLCDKDPSVMAASLCLFLEMSRSYLAEFKDLIPSFVSILKQVAENRLPRSYEYHNVPAPWIQINLLKLLGLFGANDQPASEHMYEVLHQVMQKAERHKNNAGFAVLYECIRTVINIRATPELLEAAASSIGEFLRLRNHNLKYLGIKALASIVKIAPRFVAPHQLDIIECLESTDESLKRKTLDLLYRMTNTKNVVATTAKLIEYLQNTVATDERVRAELVSRITELAERYAPTNYWYIDTMSVMLHLGGSLIRPEVAHNLIRLIAQGSGEDEEADNKLRKYAVATFLRSLEKGGSVLPDIEVNVICWVVGEYGYLSETDPPLDTIVGLISDLMERHHEDPSTRGWILTALLKLVGQLQTCPHQVLSLVEKYSRSRHVDSQLRANEFLALVRVQHILEEVLPIDASCEDIEVDIGLPFLDGYVQDALVVGASAYLPVHQRKSTQSVKLYHSSFASGGTSVGSKKDWNFSYPAPAGPTTQVPVTLSTPSLYASKTPTRTSSASSISSSSLFAGTSTSTNSTPPRVDPAIPNQQNVPSIWTKQGFQGNKHTPTKSSTPQKSQSANNVFTPPAVTQPSFSSWGKPAAAPKKLNENQEKLALQLFGGLSIDNNPNNHIPEPGADRHQPRTKSPPKRDNVKPTARPTPTPTPTPATAAPTTPTTSSRSAATLTSTPTSTSHSTELLIDLMGDLTPTSTTPSPSPSPLLSMTSSITNNTTQTPATSSTPSSPTPSKPTSTSSFTRGRYAPPATATPSSTTQPSPPLPTSSPPKPSVFDDLLSLDVASSSTSRTAPPVSHSLLDHNAESSAPSSSDMVLAPSAPLAAQVTPGDNFDLSNLAHTPFMWSLFDGCPTPEPNKTLSSDANLRVSYTKVMKKEDTVVMLLLSNANAGVLTDVSVEVTVPDHFSADDSADNVVRVNINNNTHVYTVSSINSHITIVVAMKLRHRKHGFNLSLEGKVKYRAPAANTNTKGKEIQLANWQVPVDISDLLRPVEMSTDTFGGQWAQHTQEKKTRFTPSTPYASIGALLEAVCKGLSIKRVQLIGNEGIAAGSLVNGDVCLVHSSIVGLAVDILVRTKDKSFTEVVARQLHKIIR